MVKKSDIPIGSKIGKLTVVEKVLPQIGRAHYKCYCDCDLEKEHLLVFSMAHLKTRGVKSCGCYARERAIVHGESKSITYRSWAKMKSRCLDKNNNRYSRYGGRGIRVCENWLQFENFLSDMGERPSKLHSIDRIDTDGDYEPGNCRWSTAKEQANNREYNHSITWNGITKNIMVWEQELKLPVERRINLLGWSIEKALTTPSQTYRKPKSK